jgi:hypothetical protein
MFLVYNLNFGLYQLYIILPKNLTLKYLKTSTRSSWFALHGTLHTEVSLLPTLLTWSTNSLFQQVVNQQTKKIINIQITLY